VEASNSRFIFDKRERINIPGTEGEVPLAEVDARETAATAAARPA
jgi:hypothetical protein